MIFWMVNHCNALDLLAYRWAGRSLRQLLGRAGVIWLVYPDMF